MDSDLPSGVPTRAFVARLVAEHRRLAGLTQEELSERSGLSTRAISDLERGRVDRPRRSTVEALASALAPGGVALLRLLAPGRAGAATPVLPGWPAGRPHPLPRAVADLTGRQEQLARITAVADDHAHTTAVVALLGEPGVGKTALAVSAGHRLADRFPDGTVFLGLRGTQPDPLSPGAAAEHLLRAIGVHDGDVPPADDDRLALFQWLVRDLRLLVVADDAADEAQVRPLLPNSPGSLVLITSRRTLSGLESVVRLALEVLSPAESVELLGAIAGHDRVAAEAGAALRIAELCDHLPLALRIAGNRLADRPDWPISRLERRLRDPARRLSALTAGDLDVRSALAHSYDRLAPAARKVFRGLGLLPGPAVAVGTVAVVSGLALDAAEEQLEALVDARVLHAAADGDYLVSGLVRLFARELLTGEHGRAPTARQECARATVVARDPLTRRIPGQRREDRAAERTAREGTAAARTRPIR
ncbi:helix-turn-helix domain-containing protein [Umezawaea beigongshangensis]|uniref:helix-turn-helix domain-containing protein n=1 Tax=Umezawaea beigongshangensis TaxID=2780383 RepID=UPI0018F10EE5|nr:helix-turn-helix domain-containing protein [Umezawaea beigongshangensis]